MKIFFEIKKGQLVATKTKNESTFCTANVEFIRNPQYLSIENFIKNEINTFNDCETFVTEEIAMDFLNTYEKNAYRNSMDPRMQNASMISIELI